MKDTKIYIIGQFSKEDLARIVREIAKIQKEKNPNNEIEKRFLIWISNDAHTDDEVRRIIRENFKEFEVTDLVEESGDEVFKALQKREAS